MTAAQSLKIYEKKDILATKEDVVKVREDF